MTVSTIRSFLYPMQKSNESDKVPLRITAHIGGKEIVLHESDDAAGEFKMQGLLQDTNISKWYIQDGMIVIDIGYCPYCSAEFSEGQSIKFCRLRSNRSVCDGKLALTYQQCSHEQCLLADRK